MSRNASFPVIVVFALACGGALAQQDPVAFRYNLATRHTYALTPPVMDWQTARSYSRSLGGHLVAINDGAEQSFIQSQYGGTQPPPYWIGLSDHEVEGLWKWDSGEPVLFANFCVNEPNNFGGAEDYCEIFPAYAGGPSCWNDTQSPYAGPGVAPAQGIIELPFGRRVDFDTPPPVGFQCVSPFPTPLGAPGYPEGISWNGASLGHAENPFLCSVPEEGMPVSGGQYLRMPAWGVRSVPPGGPLLRPVPPGINEVRVEIPPGTKGVSLAWEFIAKHFGGGVNDGMDISVVDAQGALIANLAYADCTTPWVPCAIHMICNSVSGGSHVAPVGPGTVAKALPTLPHPAYVSIVCWNGFNNNASSIVHVDAIQFWGSSSFQLDITAPLGPGSVRLKNTGGGAGHSYWTAVTLVQGAFPNGWLFGLDIPPTLLIDEVMMGTPFAGILDAAGSSTFTVPAGVPPGLHVYGVSLEFGSSGTIATSFLGASAPTHFVVP
jgi:Lectin C-type domain